MPSEFDSGERRVRLLEQGMRELYGKFGEVMAAVVEMRSDLKSVKGHVERIDTRQWEERPSAQITVPLPAPTPSRTSVRPEFKQVGAMGAIVVLVQLVAELVRFIVAPQPATAVPIQVPARSQAVAQEALK